MQCCNQAFITPKADKGGYLYVSAVNRAAEPRALHIKGYDIVECVTIQTKEYSFESNDFAVCKTKNADLHGHSVLFIKAVPCNQP